MTQNTIDFDGESPFVTVAEVARHLKISKMTVYRLLNNGTLPATKIGRCYRMRQSAVEEYLNNAEHTP